MTAMASCKINNETTKTNIAEVKLFGEHKSSTKTSHTHIKETYEPIYLRVPYFWYVRTKTRVKIMCDENIKSPHPYNTPWGTAQRKPNEHQNNHKGIKGKQLQFNSILTINQDNFKDTFWRRQCSEFRSLHNT